MAAMYAETTDDEAFVGYAANSGLLSTGAQPTTVEPPSSPVSSGLNQRHAPNVPVNGQQDPASVHQQGWYGNEYNAPPPVGGGNLPPLQHYYDPRANPVQGNQGESKTYKPENVLDACKGDGRLLGGGGCLHMVKLIAIAWALAAVLHFTGRPGATLASLGVPDPTTTASKKTPTGGTRNAVLQELGEDKGNGDRAAQAPQDTKETHGSQQMTGLKQVQNGMMNRKGIAQLGQNGNFQGQNHMMGQNGIMGNNNMMMQGQNSMMQQQPNGMMI